MLNALDVGKAHTQEEENAQLRVLLVTNVSGKDTLLPSAFPEQSKLQLMK